MHHHTVHYGEHPGELVVPEAEFGADGDASIRSSVVMGDAFDVLAGLPDEFVRTVVTSPPYWSLRDYSSRYLDKLVLHFEVGGVGRAQGEYPIVAIQMLDDPRRCFPREILGGLSISPP